MRVQLRGQLRITGFPLKPFGTFFDEHYIWCPYHSTYPNMLCSNRKVIKVLCFYFHNIVHISTIFFPQRRTRLVRSLASIQQSYSHYFFIYLNPTKLKTLPHAVKNCGRPFFYVLYIDIFIGRYSSFY